jgi:hypothetical protein
VLIEIALGMQVRAIIQGEVVEPHEALHLVGGKCLLAVDKDGGNATPIRLQQPLVEQPGPFQIGGEQADVGVGLCDDLLDASRCAMGREKLSHPPLPLSG